LSATHAVVASQPVSASRLQVLGIAFASEGAGLQPEAFVNAGTLVGRRLAVIGLRDRLFGRRRALHRGLVRRRALAGPRLHLRLLDARQDLVEIESGLLDPAWLRLAGSYRFASRIPRRLLAGHRRLVGIAGPHQVERDAGRKCEPQDEADE
jgi:hypothetical protein